MAVSPPRPKGIPLNSIRALEAALRHGSYTGAARELCVTQGAVAQQIKTAEQWAGSSLFERKAQGVEPNAIGRAILPQLENAFDTLGQAANNLRRLAAPGNITIATLPGIAQLWLSPRLPLLRQTFPDINLTIVAMEQPPNLLREQFDLSLFFTSETSPGEKRVEIADDLIAPVCTPDMKREILARSGGGGINVLHDATWNADWDLWQQATGHPKFSAIRHSTYSLYSLALEEARHGAGVLIGHHALVKPLIDDGQLVALSEQWIATGKQLCLHHMEESGSGSMLFQLVEWLADS